jgi:hypothetical protein
MNHAWYFYFFQRPAIAPELLHSDPEPQPVGEQMHRARVPV